MKKIATGAVFAAFVVASIAPAAAATSRPKAAAIDSSVLAATVPVTLASSSSSTSSSDGLVIGTYVGTRPNVIDPTLYAGLLGYFKADLDFQGAVYQGLQDAGVSTAALTAAYGKLNKATLALIAYLQGSITNA